MIQSHQHKTGLETVHPAPNRPHRKIRSVLPERANVICIDLFFDSVLLYRLVRYVSVYISRVFCAKVFEKYWTYTFTHSAHLDVHHCVFGQIQSLPPLSAPLASHSKQKDQQKRQTATFP